MAQAPPPQLLSKGNMVVSSWPTHPPSSLLQLAAWLDVDVPLDAAPTGRDPHLSRDRAYPDLKEATLIPAYPDTRGRGRFISLGKGVLRSAPEKLTPPSTSVTVHYAVLTIHPQPVGLKVAPSLASSLPAPAAVTPAAAATAAAAAAAAAAASDDSSRSAHDLHTAATAAAALRVAGNGRHATDTGPRRHTWDTTPRRRLRRRRTTTTSRTASIL